MLEKSFLIFKENRRYVGKTKVYHVYSAHTNDLLGIIKWNCHWREYWFEIEDSGMTWECLLEELR